MKRQKNSFSPKQPKIYCTNLSSSMPIVFQKHFSISNVQQNTQTYALPEPGSMFAEPPWQFNQLQEIKKNLNKVKSRLNNFNLSKWQQHTNRMNEAGDIVRAVKNEIQAELVTQAWCKFYEIASNFSLVPLNEICREVNGKNFRSVHLCEAPGSFVTALNHWLTINAPDVQWDWLATTLNPYCEGNSYDSMVADDRFIKYTLKHWCFGNDNTGDIMDLRNLDVLVKRAESLNDERRILLVTADGSVDCTDVPAEQESVVAQLHLCETVACMHLLQKGGNFLLKLFTLFEHQSVCLMYLLSCVFHQVNVTKPASSKGGNSEIYVVCMNFKGRDYIAPYLPILRQYYGNVPPVNAMFSLQDIPKGFLRKIEECSKFFKTYQCQVITNNIETFRKKQNVSKNSSYVESNLTIRRQISSKYLEICRLNKIDSANEIIGREKIERNNNQIINTKWLIDSYNERSKRQDLTPQECLEQLWETAQNIECPPKKFYIWDLQVLPKDLEIQSGKLFNKVRSSRFCDSKILQILTKIDHIVQKCCTTVCFPSEVTRELAQQIDLNHEILSFQFAQDYDGHQTIVKIYDRLKELQSKQTLIFIGYSLLTQLNVGLLFLLRNFFDKIIVEIHHNEGYRIKLETYRCNEEILNYLDKILMASYNARQKNMAVWSIVPITILYGKIHKRMKRHPF